MGRGIEVDRQSFSFLDKETDHCPDVLVLDLVTRLVDLNSLNEESNSLGDLSFSLRAGLLNLCLNCRNRLGTGFYPFTDRFDVPRYFNVDLLGDKKINMSRYILGGFGNLFGSVGNHIAFVFWMLSRLSAEPCDSIVRNYAFIYM